MQTLVLLAAVALMIAVATALAVAHYRRRRAGADRALAREAVPHAIVLVHGVLGFDRIELLGHSRDYFHGIAEALEATGARVHVAKLSPLGSIPQRATQLAELIRGLPYDRVSIIAHSLGGLDARYAISRYGLGSRVAALVTIGTPHRGTPVAEIGTALPAAAVRALLARAGIRSDLIDWLTPSGMERFNRDVPDAPDVYYASVVGRAALSTTGLHPMLRPIHAVVCRRAGTNDGLVPTSSQRWGDCVAEVEADHWAQIGWSSHFDAPELYSRLADRLKQVGVQPPANR